MLMALLGSLLEGEFIREEGGDDHLGLPGLGGRPLLPNARLGGHVRSHLSPTFIINVASSTPCIVLPVKRRFQTGDWATHVVHARNEVAHFVKEAHFHKKSFNGGDVLRTYPVIFTQTS